MHITLEYDAYNTPYDLLDLLQRYKKYFELNDPAKGGSFYIQSKIFRSKEVLDKELDGTNAAEAEAEANADGKASTEQPPNEDKKDSK